MFENLPKASFDNEEGSGLTKEAEYSGYETSFERLCMEMKKRMIRVNALKW